MLLTTFAIGGLCYVFRAIRRNQNGGATRLKVVDGGALTKAVPLLTSAELNFYRVLVACCPSGAQLTIKPRLLDLVRPHEAGNVTLFNKLKQKHVDFVLLDETTFRPILAIELNDRSHDAERIAARDEFVNDVLKNAFIPVLWIRVQRAYDHNVIAAAIERELGITTASTLRAA